MNIITTSVLRNNLADTIGMISKSKKYLLVSKNKKISTAIVDIDLFEDLLASTNSQYLKEISQARAEYKAGKFTTLDIAFGQI